MIPIRGIATHFLNLVYASISRDRFLTQSASAKMGGGVLFGFVGQVRVVLGANKAICLQVGLCALNEVACAYPLDVLVLAAPTGVLSLLGSALIDLSSASTLGVPKRSPKTELV